jgi:hypothetical protein
MEDYGRYRAVESVTMMMMMMMMVVVVTLEEWRFLRCYAVWLL